MERVRTMTIANWHHDDDDDDDHRFFASCSSSDDDDQDFDDCRLSFVSAVSSSAATPDLYDVWIASPGSITERRKRLLQGMGLATDNRLSSADPPEAVPREIPLASASPSPPVPVVLVRSRSDGDVVQMAGSKQRLARTYSVPLQDRMIGAPKESALSSSSSSGAYFVIKNLDTGKEFVVNEYAEDGTWNRLSDLQTGKQLSMDEFEKSVVGYSPVVKELMRRHKKPPHNNNNGGMGFSANSLIYKSLRRSKRRGVALIKSGIRGVTGLIYDKDTHKPPEPGNPLPPPPEWIKARQSGKSHKELSALHLCQEIQAHHGAIWTMRFSADARFLASAGQDRTVHVWEVQECHVMPLQKKGKGPSARKSCVVIPEYVHVPDTVFGLSDKPVCSFQGHLDDVLDLSWSTSQLLLSSSMDKTVRLWDLETKSCLKLFAHNDYVTCIQFNPMDEDYFISGSLDAKVRIWSIPDRQVVDWTDFHEMVTAASYTPDGQGAFIGSHKGNIRIYSTQDCKLSQTAQIDILNKKKSHAKKITGFQFSPTNPTQVLVTSADSRVRILEGQTIVHKFKGFRNTSSQIAASFSQDGKYVISASEDSHVYVWKREENNQRSQSSSVKRNTMINTSSFEQFQCRDVSMAIPWPNNKRSLSVSASASPTHDVSKRHLPPLPKKSEESVSVPGDSFSSEYGDVASWFDGGATQAAWGLVVVTAGLGGEIRAYQNFGLPRKVGRQTSLFGGPT